MQAMEAVVRHSLQGAPCNTWQREHKAAAGGGALLHRAIREATPLQQAHEAPRLHHVLLVGGDR